MSPCIGTGTVTSTGFSPDGQRIITTSFDKSARIWEVATGGQIMMLHGHTDAVSSASFSPDGRHILTSSLDKTARIWDALTGRPTLLLSGVTVPLRQSVPGAGDCFMKT